MHGKSHHADAALHDGAWGRLWPEMPVIRRRAPKAIKIPLVPMPASCYLPHGVQMLGAGDAAADAMGRPKTKQNISHTVIPPTSEEDMHI